MMTQSEHGEFMVWLEQFIAIAIEKTYGYQDFMRHPYLKLANDTFTDLLNNYDLADL